MPRLLRPECKSRADYDKLIARYAAEAECWPMERHANGWWYVVGSIGPGWCHDLGAEYREYRDALAAERDRRFPEAS